MAKVYAPNKQYTGVSAGVTFINGIGETSDPHLLEWFREHGYTVEDEPLVEPKPLEKMTVAELKEYAEQHGINLGDSTKKDDILAVILAAKGGDKDAGN
jgi:hypothetical protein